jgi:hypothetical protein
VIDWADVGYLATDAATVQLKSSRGKLARLHPVRLPVWLRLFLISTASKSLNRWTMKRRRKPRRNGCARQAQILGDMDEERAADILEHMSPDEAADVLGDLPEDKAEGLLNLMEDEEQSEVAELCLTTTIRPAVDDD